MHNANHLISVSFPNGQTRRRNCSTTINPTERREVPGGADVYSKRNYTNMAVNKLITESTYHSQSYKAFVRRQFYRGLLIIATVLAIMAIGTTIIITETN